jgi:hypothetical protein
MPLSPLITSDGGSAAAPSVPKIHGNRILGGARNRQDSIQVLSVTSMFFLRLFTCNSTLGYLFSDHAIFFLFSYS